MIWSIFSGQMVKNPYNDRHNAAGRSAEWLGPGYSETDTTDNATARRGWQREVPLNPKGLLVFVVCPHPSRARADCDSTRQKGRAVL